MDNGRITCGAADDADPAELRPELNLIRGPHHLMVRNERFSMDAALIALTDRGARFTFLGEPFRSREKIPNEDIVDINFSQVEITDADVEALLPLTNLEGISFWKTGISDEAIKQIAHLPRLTRLNLCGTQVTDASVSTLVGMALSYIDVADTQLTPHGVETLRAKMPSAEILS